MAGKYLSILVHFVWSTASREPWLSDLWEDELYKVIGGILRKKNGKLLEAGGVGSASKVILHFISRGEFP